MCDGSYTVNTDVLRTHGGVLAGQARALDACKTALDTAVSTQAFGIMCQFLAEPVRETGPSARDAITALANVGQSASVGVVAMAATYELLEMSAEAQLKLVAEGLA